MIPKTKTAHTWSRGPWSTRPAINGDDGQIEYGADRSEPDEVFAEQYSTEPVAATAGQVEIAELQRVNESEREAAEEIKCVLVDDQHVLPVLFGGDQSV